MTRFDLPEVCLATGAAEGVRYRPATFVFVPLWARLSVVFCGLVGIVVMLVSMKRVRAELPFTEEAWDAWVRAKRVSAGLVVAAVVSLVVAVLLDYRFAMPGLVAFVALLVAAVAYSLTVVKQAGPLCKGIDDRVVTLELPNELAAEAIEKRLGLGAHGASATSAAGEGGASVDPDEDELDRKLQAELDAMP